MEIAAKCFHEANIVLGAGSFGDGAANAGVVNIAGAGPGMTTVGSVTADGGAVVDLSECLVVGWLGGLQAVGAGSALFAWNVEIGECSYYHALARDYGFVSLSDYTVSGDVVGGSHIEARSFGSVWVGGSVGISAAIDVDAFAKISVGPALIEFEAVTFTGAANVTGKKYDIDAGGVCHTHGEASSFLPGTVSGTTAHGGQYL